MNTDKPILVKREAAALLRVSERTLDGMVKQGIIPHKRIGPRTIRFSRQQLMEFLSKGTAA